MDGPYGNLTFMVPRPVWVERVLESWRKAPIAWLSGVRRVGKTTLAHQLENVTYFNCDLPSTQDLLRDPESLFASVRSRAVVLDEVHQLEDPSRVLKIAADEFPKLRILATGSSTIAATTKFRDALTGRKREVHMVPVLCEELPAFGVVDLKIRMLHGGLPAMLVSQPLDREGYSEWLDSYYARDVQELFRVEKRTAFLRFCELVIRQSGGMFEVASLARDAAISRPTVTSWLEVLEVTHAITLLRPHHGGGAREIVAQPKVYAFDTGFVCHARRWDTLRDDDCGVLWEHLVLETLQSIPALDLRYWRDKAKHEVDFVIPRARDACDVIECKWGAGAFSAKNLSVFRDAYPKGRNFVVSPRRAPPVTRTEGGLTVTHLSPDQLRVLLTPRVVA